ncbi:BTBD1_2 [Mytilus coruscus]|uniref:BTBD1_2 n=1 Tax=Mytilus coruscus TaxID=42192 RepID=A0A6J8ET35_MYTCO|nr:BTBD1_2 [Mytilus coruscus]
MNKKEPFDWTERKTLQECMMYMFDNEIMCDVTFLVGGNRKAIKAHKNILASRSPIFRSMFDGSQTEEKEINVPNIDEDTLKLYFAQEYSLSSINTKCSELLKSTAKSANSVLTLSTANQFHLEDLQKESLQYIEDNTGDCLLSVHAVEWAETQCKRQQKELNAHNLRSIAGELVSLIKFPLVKKIYFSTEVSTSMLLTPDEIQSVLLYHKGTKCQLFSEKPRCPRKVTFICKHEQTLNNIYPIFETPSNDEFTFRSNNPIWLKGCVIFGPVDQRSGSGSFTFHLQDNSKKYIHSENLDLVCGNVYDQRVAIRVSKPIPLIANTPYTINVRDFRPCAQYYAYVGMLGQVYTQDDFVITFAISSRPFSFSPYVCQISGILCST